MMKRLFPQIICLALAILLMSSSFASAAQNGCPTKSMRATPATGDYVIGNCANKYSPANYEPHHFTYKVVNCTEGAIRSAVLKMLTIISREFAWVFGVISTLVIVFFGVRVAMGEKELLRYTATLFIKLAFIAAFLGWLPELVGYVYAVLAQAIALVAGGSPWLRIDKMIALIFGFSPEGTLMQGLLGVIGASIVSNSVGILLFFTGVMAVMSLITFVVGVVYTYVLTMLVIGFLLTLSPIMIPLALFFYSERYMKKWADIIVSAMLTPILLFAVIALFVNIVGVLIENIFTLLGGKDFQSILRTSTPFGSWQMASDLNTSSLMQNLPKAGDLDCIKREMVPPVQSNVNPLAHNHFDTGRLQMPTINFGANAIYLTQQLSFAMTTLWLFCSLMKTAVQKIPGVASSIASVSNTQISFGGGSAVLSKMEGAVGKMKQSLGSSAGADISKNMSKIDGFMKQMGSMLGRRN